MTRGAGEWTKVLSQPGQRLQAHHQEASRRVDKGPRANYKPARHLWKQHSRGVGGVKVERSLRGNQEDVVGSDLHGGSLDGLSVGVASPGGGVGGEAVVQPGSALLSGVGGQQPLHILAAPQVTVSGTERQRRPTMEQWDSH